MSPGVRHEIPLDMIQRRPAFALELLALALGADTSKYRDVRIETVELNSILPTERIADSVISVATPHNNGRRLYVIVEVQHEYVESKWWRWCSYVGTLMGRHQRPVILVVVCPDATVAAKYDQGFMPDHSCLILRPVAIGPDRLPRMVTPEDVLASPEMATLAAVARPRVEDVIAVARSLVTLSDERSEVYYSYLAASLPEVVRVELEKHMAVTFDLIDNEFTRRWMARGRAEGEAHGIAQGVAQGRTEGEAHGKATALITILETRGFPLDDDQRTTITTCRDTERLDDWITRAITALTLDDVFTP